MPSCLLVFVGGTHLFATISGGVEMFVGNPWWCMDIEWQFLVLFDYMLLSPCGC